MLKLEDKDITYYPICVVPPERHYDSYMELVNDMKWYEQSRAYIYKDNPAIKPPMGKFEKVRNNNTHTFILLPTSLDYGVLYRGQDKCYGRCLPSLYRKTLTDDEVFVENVRVAEFRLFLEQLDITKLFQECNYEVDFVGLAQHYGLKTEVLDVTSDIFVSLFFAMCDYDEVHDCYVAKCEDKEYVGYIYTILSNEQSNDSKNAFGVFSNKIKVIGLQPFERPGAQKGFAYHIGKQGIFHGYLYSFSYTKEDSSNIYNMFHQGKDLWRKDFIVDVAGLIARTRTFSSEAVSLASRMFTDTISIRKRSQKLKDAGCQIIGRKKQPWTSISRPVTQTMWNEIQNQIVERTMISPKETKKCRDLQHVGMELFTNYLYGCTDCPHGYDSGMEIMVHNKTQFTGICRKRMHEPLVPDELDGKIHAEWIKSGNVNPRTRSFQVPESFKQRITFSPNRTHY